MTKAESWYRRIKTNHIDPIVDTLTENIPAITVAVSLLAVGIAVRSTKDANDELNVSMEKNNQLLSIIEEKIGIAIEAPTIVRVELGDDIELFGMGNRTS